MCAGVYGWIYVCVQITYPHWGGCVCVDVQCMYVCTLLTHIGVGVYVWMYNVCMCAYYLPTCVQVCMGGYMYVCTLLTHIGVGVYVWMYNVCMCAHYLPTYMGVCTLQ